MHSHQSDKKATCSLHIKKTFSIPQQHHTPPVPQSGSPGQCQRAGVLPNAGVKQKAAAAPFKYQLWTGLCHTAERDGPHLRKRL